MMTALIQHVLGGSVRASGSASTLIICCGIAIGMFLWLAGSRFSQSLITLSAVGLGTIVGLQVPGLTGWPVAPWATAVVAALALGLCGYSMHQMCAGTALALLLAFWAVGVAIANYGLGTIAMTLGPEQGQSWLDHGYELWGGLPADLRRIGPFVCAFALVFGAGLALIWIRMATALLYSLLGVSMIVISGSAAIALGQTTLQRLVPAWPMLDWSIFAAMVLIGVLLQWRWTAKPAARSPVKSRPAQKEKQA